MRFNLNSYISRKDLLTRGTFYGVQSFRVISYDWIRIEGCFKETRESWRADWDFSEWIYSCWRRSRVDQRTQVYGPVDIVEVFWVWRSDRGKPWRNLAEKRMKNDVDSYFVCSAIFYQTKFMEAFSLQKFSVFCEIR